MKRNIFILPFMVGIFLFSTTPAGADIRLPRIFSSNMVLQQGMAIPVWGRAAPGERVTVTLDKTSVKATATREGKWKIQLPSQPSGGPFKMTVSGKNTIQLDNVMLGEVWVCSGQSNMEFPLSSVLNAEVELAAANYPGIRLFQVPKKVSQQPLEDIESGEWNICTPKTVSSFSAVGYFFGRELHLRLNVPVGLLETSWGGTVAETWISGQTIENDPDFSEMLKNLKAMDMNKYYEGQKEKIRKLFGGEIPSEDKGIVDGKPVWAAIDLDDSDWKTIVTPGLWEEQGYAQVDGIAWYRKEITLSEEQTNSNLTLHLGKVDDSDITWMNGFEIGKTERAYDKDRIYTIDKKYLRPGKNMLSVRVEDTGGGGGIWGDPGEQFLITGSEKMNISGKWKFRIAKALIASMNVEPNSYPTLLYNGMINPVVPFGIKGAIWYQGESNAGRARQYQRIFPNLITDWRNHWGEGDFPFLFVSLANYMRPAEQPGESSWAELREAQTKTLALPNTGMAVIIDIGDAKDIHPRNKQDVGLRLSLNALKIAYKENIIHTGPLYRSVEFRDGRAFVTFDVFGSSLVVKDRYGYPKGFSVAGADKKFYWAQARIIDSDKMEILSPKVTTPVAVRYGWADNPDDVNIYNTEGLPANPFRTDNGE